MFETQNSGNKSDPCIPVISVSIDLPEHIYLYQSESNFYEKKNHLNSSSI